MACYQNSPRFRSIPMCRYRIDRYRNWSWDDRCRTGRTSHSSRRNFPDRPFPKLEPGRPLSDGSGESFEPPEVVVLPELPPLPVDSDEVESREPNKPDDGREPAEPAEPAEGREREGEFASLDESDRLEGLSDSGSANAIIGPVSAAPIQMAATTVVTRSVHREDPIAAPLPNGPLGSINPCHGGASGSVAAR